MEKLALMPILATKILAFIFSEIAKKAMEKED